MNILNKLSIAGAMMGSAAFAAGSAAEFIRAFMDTDPLRIRGG